MLQNERIVVFDQSAKRSSGEDTRGLARKSDLQFDTPSTYISIIIVYNNITLSFTLSFAKAPVVVIIIIIIICRYVLYRIYIHYKYTRRISTQPQLLYNWQTPLNLSLFPGTHIVNVRYTSSTVFYVFQYEAISFIARYPR